MPPIEMRLLGPFEVRDSAGEILSIKARKSRALLALLALAPAQSLPRERMMNLLWSERGDAQARSSLRQALAGLRSDLAATGAAALDTGHDRASINPANVKIDILEFRRLAASDDVASLRGAYALYRGELLADTFVRDPAFEEWLGAERQRLADIAASVVERLCSHETGAARIDLAKRLVAIDPLREASHRLLMRAYLDAGERALALRQYEVCREVLRDELQIFPGEETEALRRLCLEPHGSEQKASGRKGAAERTEGPGVPAFVDDRPLLAVLPLDTF
jgi:DNA-binding SARP family transcriptional activator